MAWFWQSAQIMDPGNQPGSLGLIFFQFTLSS
jgi:hypothetical protein